MSYVARTAEFRPSIASSVASTAPATRRNLFRWLYDAVMHSNERRAQSDVDRLVSWRDGGFNDRLEQEIAERFYVGDWHARR